VHEEYELANGGQFIRSTLAARTAARLVHEEYELANSGQFIRGQPGNLLTADDS
jgi:hypothetical protein